METAKQAAETILALLARNQRRNGGQSPGSVWRKNRPEPEPPESGREGERYRFDDLTAQPRKIITSPIWSGIESEDRRYSPFVINIEEKVPFRTLTGRAQFYQDHPWMRDFGEHLPCTDRRWTWSRWAPRSLQREAGKEIVLNYLTPHSKWSIHSTYSDTLTMLTLFRGGRPSGSTTRMPEKSTYQGQRLAGMLQRQRGRDGQGRGQPSDPPGQGVHVPCPGTADQHAGVETVRAKRGGTHNSVTRIMVKPTHMIGGYAQLSYGFNYYGPIGPQRDEADRRAQGRGGGLV
jgi:nitrate reductase / nitrite oxidoreductase, alpha subunit